MQPLSVFALAFSLAAQTVVFPSDHTTIPNGSSQQGFFPYSYGVSHMMALYESWDLHVPNGHQITKIGFRANGTTIAYGKSLQLDVRMGTTDRTASNAFGTFANNYLGAPTTVFGPALFVMPDLNNVLNPNPDGPVIWLTLTTPFTFDASHNLLVEWRVYANNNGGAAFSYPLDVATFDSPTVTGPSGCPHSGNQVADLSSRPTRVGGTWVTDLYQAPASQPTVLFLNVGVPLTPPFSLAAVFPGIQPTCQGQVSPMALFSLGGVTGTNGNLIFQVPVPNDRLLNDLVLSSQAFSLDFFSPGGAVVSNGAQVQVGIDPAMAVIYHQGSASNATGAVNANYGIVTLFSHN